MSDDNTRDQEPILARGCGQPKKGGLYLSIGIGTQGIPLSSFFIDPTVPVPNELNLPSLGMIASASGAENLDGKQIYHVFDHIGEDGYPNVWDFIMEINGMGFHRKISRTFPFHLITQETMYFAVHTKAGITKPQIYRDNYLQSPSFPRTCTKKHKDGETCLYWLSNDVVGGVPASFENTNGRDVLVTCGSTQYYGFKAPEGANPSYIRSIFLALPIGLMGGFTYYTDNSEELNAREDGFIENLPKFMGYERYEVE